MAARLAQPPEPSVGEPVTGTAVANPSRPRRITQPSEEPPTWRLFARRAIPIAISGVVLYVLAPVLLRVLSAWPRLSSLVPIWAVVGLVAEVASFACTFLLKRIALRTKAVFAVVMSGLTGNAVTNVFPGADATGAAVEMRMLATAGIATVNAVSGLTATALLQTGSVLALPVLSLPAILAGVAISKGLFHLVILGLAVFLVYTVAALVVFRADWPLRWIGRVVESVHNRLLPRRPRLDGLSDRLVGERDSTRAALGAKWWQALLCVSGRLGLDFACLLAALAAARTTPEPWLILIAYAGTTVVALLPLTPGGLGLVEGSLTGLLVLASVPASRAVLATLAYRLASYWLPTLAGPAAFLAFKRRYRAAPDDPRSPGGKSSAETMDLRP